MRRSLRQSHFSLKVPQCPLLIDHRMVVLSYRTRSGTQGQDEAPGEPWNDELYHGVLKSTVGELRWEARCDPPIAGLLR